MQEYTEKRRFPRMDIECPARFEIVGEQARGAIVKNLSGGGVLLWIERSFQPDTELTIEIVPVRDITPPMRAVVHVLRCTPIDEAAGNYAVACAIERVVD